MSVMDTALYWTGWGTSVIPVQPKDKRPAIPWKEYQKNSIPSLQQINTWFVNGINHNVGIIAGYRHLTILDFDDQGTYTDWMGHCSRSGGRAAQVARYTYRVQTARGFHVYVTLPHTTKSRDLHKPDGSTWVEIKSFGRYVLGAGSVHPTGHVYRANDDHAPVMRVSALSDILPADMLIQIDYQPKRTTPRPAPVGDIWDQVMNPVSMGPGTVDRIKARYQLEDLLPTEQATGADKYLTCCPLHDDHNPSMWVDTTQQICGCFSGCTGKPLDVVNLYARIHDLSNSEAIRELAREL